MSSLERIAKFGIRNNYKKDDIICMQGDSGDNMYIVLKGNFNVYINSMTDFPIKVSEVTPGQFFGEMSMLDDAPRSATVIAGEDSLAISVSKEDFRQLMKEDDELAFSVMRTLSGRVRTLNEKLEKNHMPLSNETSAVIVANDGKIPILPKQHRLYGIQRPSKFDFFVNERQIKCPVCGRDFNENAPNFSKLTQKGFTTLRDQRVIYENFDILWYSVWACPNCKYAEYYSAFGSVTDDTVRALKAGGYSSKVEKVSGKGVENIDDVIERYYLVLLCNTFGARNPFTEAKTWLRLYWLYSDAQDNDNKLKAAEKALLCYQKIAGRMEAADRLQAYVIMAELSIALEKFQKAAAIYEQVCIEAKKSNALLHAQAFSRLSELKELQKASNSAPNPQSR